MGTTQIEALAARNSRRAISAVFFAFGMLVGSWLPHIPDVQKQLNLNYALVGNALLCSGFGAVVIMPILGSLIHRFGSRPIILISGIGACSLVPMLAFEKSLLGLCINLICNGLCYGALDVAMNTHSMKVQELHNRPIVSAIHGWYSLGGILGGLGAAAAFRLGLSFNTHILLVGIGLDLIVIASYLYLLPAATDKGMEGPKLVIPTGVLLVLGLLVICAYVEEGGILDWCALYVRQSLHASPESGGIVTAVCSGAMACGRFIGDSLLDRFGNRTVVLIGGWLAFLGVLGAVATGSLTLCILSLAISGFGIANMVPVVFKQSTKVPGVPSSTAMAALSTCGYAGFLLGPPAIGAVAHDLSLRFSFGSLGLLGLIVAVVSPKVLDSSS